MKLKSRLLANGITAEKVHETIFRNIYPLPQRLWWKLRLALNFNPFTAERQFVDDLAHASSADEIDQAMFDYLNERHEYKALLMRPSRKRARSYFHRVMNKSAGESFQT